MQTKKLTRRLSIGLIIVGAAINFACATHLSCMGRVVEERQKITDGRGLPYKAFVGVESTTMYGQGECSGDDDNCDIKTHSIVASGAIIYRSKTSTAVGYILTAKHFCSHIDDDVDDYIDDDDSDKKKKIKKIDKKKKIKKIGHFFAVYDYWGRRHLAKRYFSVDKVDACVMTIETMDRHLGVAKVAKDQPEAGEYVYNIASPGGILIQKGGLTFSGFYSGMQRSTAVFTIPLAGGSSGSPVFNEYAEIVGMLWGYPLRDSERINESIAFSITLQEINNVLLSVKSADVIIDSLLSLTE